MNLFKQRYSDISLISRMDTDYSPSHAIPDNSKETIQIDVSNKSEVDFIDLKCTEILMKLRIHNMASNATLGEDMSAAHYGICKKFGHRNQITFPEGDVEMNSSTGTYPYQDYFENMLQYDERDLEARARLVGYIPHKATTPPMQKIYTNNKDNNKVIAQSVLFDDR